MRFVSLLLFIYILRVNPANAQKVEVYDPTVNYQKNPINIDTEEPKFSWKINSSERNVLQTAYEIRVSYKEEALKSGKSLIWQSGKIIKDQSIHVPYHGDPLVSAKRYFWQVRVWDNQGNRSPWSPIQFWETGLLDSTDWRAKWINSTLSNDDAGPVLLFRKEFSTTKSVRNARLYITAHGMYEAEINGKRVGDEYLSPGWTSYSKRLQYQIFDVTNLLKPGRNGLGVSIGDGWFKGNLTGGRNNYGNEEALLAQLRIEYTNGDVEFVITDETWKASNEGPIRVSDLYNGELYDARMELVKWTSPHFNEDSWKKVQIKTDIPFSKLIASSAPPVKKQETFRPKEIIINKKGEKIVDFGQNLVGWVQFTVKGKEGDTIRLKHAEVLDKEGNFYTENLREAKQQIVYILSGADDETYEPHFTFQGFRYVKIEGNSEFINEDNIQAFALYSDMAVTGSFETSNALLNQLQSNIQWGQRGNFVDVPTDCPQRDERLGWTGDAQVFFNTATYNMDVASFFTKWLKDLKADQFVNGAVPHIIPHFWKEESGGAAGWADAATIIPWDFFLAYGDTTILKNHYNSMKEWIGYIEANSESYLWNKGWHFGDWLFYIPRDDRDGRAAITDKFMIAQAFYTNSIQIMLNTAEVLKKSEDISYYSSLLTNVKEAFIKEYMTPSGRLVSSSQTAYVLALHFDILPDSLRPQAAKRLVDNIISYDNHLTTGFLGTPYLCHVLSRFGYQDIAFTLLMQETYPSWLYPVKMGATTIWERWDGIKPDGTFQNPEMNSFNHYAYGAIGDWMYKNIAGIKRKNDIPAYKEFIISPSPGGGITSAQGELETPYGKISSSWKMVDDHMEMHIIIPTNTQAKVMFPDVKSTTLMEGGEKIFLKNDTLSIGSGIYHFHYQLN